MQESVSILGILSESLRLADTSLFCYKEDRDLNGKNNILPLYEGESGYFFYFGNKIE